MRALILAAALAFAAGPAFAQDADNVAHATAANNGHAIQVAAGGKLVIDLAVNPSTGAHWDVTNKPDFLGDAAITVAPPSVAPGQRPRLGAPSVATITFDVSASADGSADLTLDKRGPDGAVQDSFHAIVTTQ